MMQINNIKVEVERTSILCFVLIVSLFLCGFGNKKVIMDTESRIVYQASAAEDILKSFESDKNSAKENYADNYYIIYGIISSVKDNSKELVISSTTDSSMGISCKASDDNIIDSIKKLRPGDKVKVYGKLSVGPIKGGLSVKIESIERAGSDVISDDMYSVIGGRMIKKSDMDKQELHEGMVRYYIPSNWASVEYSIQGNNIGKIEGYQYRLNQIDSPDAYAESLFVCYFDKKWVDINDRQDDKRIEEAIIRDIMGYDKNDDIEKFPCRDEKTYYGTRYKYYRDMYKTETSEKYNVEMIFQEMDEGIGLVVYVYREEKHIDDIMVVLRMMEIETGTK